MSERLPVFDPFTYVHVSGLTTEEPPEWERFLHHATQAGRFANASVIGLTETRNADDRRAAREPGWELAWKPEQGPTPPGSTECSILWNREVWASASPAYAVKLSTTLWYPEGSNDPRPPHYALVKPLRQLETGNVVLFAVRHDPPHVDGGRKGYSHAAPNRVAAHREIWSTQADIWKEGRFRHDRAGRVLSLDANVDFGLPVWRDRWKETHEGLRLCWDMNNPPGTLGRRTVDAVAAGQKLEFVGGPQVLSLLDEFDHGPVAVRLRGRS